MVIAPGFPPNHLIGVRLKSMGFTNVKLMSVSTPLMLSEKLSIEIIPPLNKYAQEAELYEADDEPETGIDCGAVITDQDARVVLLSDNSPYNLADAGKTLERMRDADLLAFPFNGFADDYPVCYDNFTPDEKRSIAKSRAEKRVEMTAKNLHALNPRCLMPYSSDFLVNGPRAREFVEVQPAEWMSRVSAAKFFEKETNIKNLAVYEDDVIKINRGAVKVTRGSSKKTVEDAAKLAEAFYNPIPNTRYLFRPIESIAELSKLVDISSKNMFEQMSRRGLKTDWMLVIKLSDFPEHNYYLDLQSHKIVEALPDTRKRLICELESNYLNAILTGNASWNGAQGSYNLTWRREPSDYDFFLYRSLHFFNVPGSGTKASSL